MCLMNYLSRNTWVIMGNLEKQNKVEEMRCTVAVPVTALATEGA